MSGDKLERDQAEVSWGDPRVREQLGLLADAGDYATLGKLVRRCERSWSAGSVGDRLSVATALAKGRDYETACALVSHGQSAFHPPSARMRAHWAMRARDYEAALEAADVAISALLEPDVSVAAFVRAVLAGTHAQQLLTVNAAQIPFARALREPFTLRWEALRRLQRARDASDMRTLCLQLWPERASVWAGAGNHALDEENFDGALRCFQRCFERDPSSIAGIAGHAIVYETRKDWEQALVWRRRAVELTSAMTRDDAPSLQRAIRFGVALARSGRKMEAGVQLRRCVALGAYEVLPAERPVLLRFFAEVLYSPAMLAQMGAAVRTDVSLLHLHRLGCLEQRVLEQASCVALAQPELTAVQRELLLGVCAWELGELERAFQHFDAADTGVSSGVEAQYWLMRSAEALGSAELPGIAAYARRAAQTALATNLPPASDTDRERLFAALTLHGAEGGLAQPRAVPQPVRDDDLLQTWLAGRAVATDDLPALGTVPRGDIATRILWWSAWRELQRRSGHSGAAVALAAPATLLQRE